MKTRCLRAYILPIAAGGLVLVSGCVVEPNGTMGIQMPTISVAPPVVVAPAVTYSPPVVVAPGVAIEAPVLVPETYIWDGYENVGIVDGQYFYLGPGDVWLACEPWRLDRFHGWERGHPDWRDHAIRNDRYRKDAHGHEAAMHGEKGGEKAKPAEKKKDDKQ
jgi:hypothetical protein